MKIVDVAEFYSVKGGGVKTYIDQKFVAGRRYGHTIVVVAPGPENRIEQRPGGKIIWVKCPKLLLDGRYHRFSSAHQVHQILTEEAPDIVEASSPWKGGRITAKWEGSACKILFWHQEPVSAYPQALLGKSLGRDRGRSSFFVVLGLPAPASAGVSRVRGEQPLDGRPLVAV